MQPNWNKIAATIKANEQLDGFVVSPVGDVIQPPTDCGIVNLLPEHRWLCLEGVEGAKRIRKWLFLVGNERAWRRENTVLFAARVEGRLWVGIGATVPLQTASRYAKLFRQDVLVGAAA